MVGDFLRCVADVDDLERALGRSRPALPALSVPSDWAEGPPWGADRLAARLRSAVGRGPVEPIASMTSLLREDLGVACFFVTPDRLAPTIDAASTCLPRPAVLVNLIEGAGAWWRTRMSLAHELCHLLVDQEAQVPSVSPDSRLRERYRTFDDFSTIERRANAFAAHLLAPDAGVRSATGGHLPTSEAAVVAVSRQFGIGRETAINRLRHVFGLSSQVRDRMMHRPHAAWTPGAGFEEEAEVGLRGGALLSLAMDAFTHGRIDAVDVRARLEIEPTEALPEWPGLTESQRAPLRAPEAHVLSVVGRFLMERDLRGLVPVQPRRTDDGWSVDLDGDPAGRSVRVSFEYEVEPPSWLAA